jgi:hypothetical protein
LKPIASADPHADPRAGFALIEMLAALAIAVAVLALLAQFTAQTLRNWSRGESTIATMEMLTSGLGRLRADLAQALPMRPPGTDSESIIFSGEPNRLLFVSTGSAAGDRGLALISVTVQEDQDGIAVIRERGSVATAGTLLRDPVILLRGRMRVQFSYRGPDGQPTATWTGQPQLPKAVAVDIFDLSGASVFPVPFVIPLPTNLLAACLSDDYDTAPNECPSGASRGRSATQKEDR